MWWSVRSAGPRCLRSSRTRFPPRRGPRARPGPRRGCRVLRCQHPARPLSAGPASALHPGPCDRRRRRCPWRGTSTWLGGDCPPATAGQLLRHSADQGEASRLVPGRPWRAVRSPLDRAAAPRHRRPDPARGRGRSPPPDRTRRCRGPTGPPAERMSHGSLSERSQALASATGSLMTKPGGRRAKSAYARPPSGPR